MNKDLIGDSLRIRNRQMIDPQRNVKNIRTLQAQSIDSPQICGAVICERGLGEGITVVGNIFFEGIISGGGLSLTGNVYAIGLKSLTTDVDTNTSAAPTIGQVLTATSGSSASWQTFVAAPITFSDATFTVYDATDNTKRVKFDAAGNTDTCTTLLTSQTFNRILTLPDVSDTLVGKATIDDFTNKNLIDTSVFFVDAVDQTMKIKIDAAGLSGTATTLLGSQTVDRILTLPDATDTLVGKATTDKFTNKTLCDTSVCFVDDTDPTMKIRFDAAGSTGTATTLLGSQTVDRILTLPDATDTLVSNMAPAFLTNKTLQASIAYGYNTTLTSAAPLVLDITSSYYQVLTGITTSVVNLPSTGTIVGTTYVIVNGSSQTVDIQASGGLSIVMAALQTSYTLVCIFAAGTTPADWLFIGPTACSTLL